MKNYERFILVTGGAGFIGSHVVRHFVTKYPQYCIINYDKLTYAGNLENLKDIEKNNNYIFHKGDISSELDVVSIFNNYRIDAIIHLAAESHVDRSILNPIDFVVTNVLGTCTLLNIARKFWENQYDGKLFFHISTDEVFGSLSDQGFFDEHTPYDPRSPYSAAKASSDHFVRAYYHTYGIPIIISNCSNNYGSYQFPEKLIPLMINNILQEKPLPVYGQGLNVRDWIHVQDHVEAIDCIFHKGYIGHTYCVGGNNEWRNIDLVKLLCQLMDEELGRPIGYSQKLITFVKDRAGHDYRYAIDTRKIRNELGWSPKIDFHTGLRQTIGWYLHNRDWLERVTSGEYLKYYETVYLNR